MQTRVLTNQAVFRFSAQFQTALESGVMLSGDIHIRAEMPMSEEQLRTFVHRPEDSIEAVLAGLNGHKESVL